ncbi:MAG: tetratricopeptide repeat protein [Bacteroidales bacterium]
MEAIEFYQEAFKVYLKNSGDEPDTQKVTKLYSKMGDAYQLGGKNMEAIEYYEKVLRHYKINSPKTKFSHLYKVFTNFISILFFTTFPTTRFKKEATDLERWLLRVLYFNGKALYSYDSKRWFLQTVYTFNFFSHFSFSSNEYGQVTLSAYSILFNWTGISLSMARKILKISGENIETKTLFLQHEYFMFSKMHQFLEGNWKMEPDLEKIKSSVVEKGDIFNLAPFLLFCGFISCELGNEKETFAIIESMKKIGEEFESDHCLAQYHRLKAVALYKFRKNDQIIPETLKGIEYTRSTGHRGMLQIIYCMHLITSAKMNDLESARLDMVEIEKLMPPLKKIKIWYSTYFLAKAYLLTEEFRRDPENKSLKSNLIKTCKSAIKQARMVPNNLIESHRIAANAMWMVGKKKTAIKHYLKSIEAGEKVNGKLELSRTYFELGKRMMSNGNHKIKGHSGEQYLEKARTMFMNMNLTYDLEELERFMAK